MTQFKAPSLTVAIGASAGGLTALKTFVNALPAENDMAFLVVQHLDPSHKSLLSSILEPLSKLRTLEAETGQTIEAGTIYILPPNADMSVEQGQIKLTKAPRTKGAKTAIDHCFKTLAEDCTEKCAGIILSGTGADGTEGLRAIAKAGGLTIAQNPETATHDNMPVSAISAGVVDVVADLEDMYAFLNQFAEDAYEKSQYKEIQEEQEKLLTDIADVLHEHEDFSLAEYKNSTVQRRIARRMSLTCSEKPSDYLKLLRESGKERKHLAEDLLINVTDFFRDPQAFQSLEMTVLERIVKNLSEEEDVRVWIAGCATGEEAYSVAILLKETLVHHKRKNPIKVFATDLDMESINRARRGEFPKEIAERIPGNLMQKYFIWEDKRNRYRISNEIRAAISFASQNVVNDPPFGRMHLISCRNLLIYLKKEIQERVISSFYFSLNTGGYLFLGTSETPGEKSKLFKTVSKKWRLYQKVDDHQHSPLMWDGRSRPSYFQTPTDNHSRSRNRASEPQVRSFDFMRSLLDTFLPPAVIVDREGKILHNHGNWAPYISISSGDPTQNLIHLVAPPLRSRLRSALFKAVKTGGHVTFVSSIPGEDSTATKRGVKIEVTPLKGLQTQNENATYGVVFFPQARTEASDQAALTQDDELKAKQSVENELAETREELQNTIEELETSTEELKASHEEALSTNEELQSANEELEASAEELRSLNEELSTVNTQLQEKIGLLQKANDDVENFFTSTDLPTIFLDPHLRVQRYTPAAEQLLKMGPGDVGREITSFGRDLIDPQLAPDCAKVLQSFQPIYSEKRIFDGRCFIRRITPYRTTDRKVDGVVIVFQDISELKQLSERAAAREAQQAVVAKLGMLALSDTDPKVLMRQVVRQVTHTLNADFCKILRLIPEKSCFMLEEGVGWHEGLVGQAFVPAGIDSQAGYTLLGKDPVIVKNLDTEKRFNGPQLLLDHHVVSGMSVVINHAEPPFGVIGVHTKEERTFSEDDANFLLAVANMLSSALRMKASQEQIFERETQFRSMANSIPQLAWMTDPTGYVQWYNQRWYDFTGSNPQEMEGWGWQKVHHPDHIKRVMPRYKDFIATERPWEDEFPLRGKDGQYRWFLSRAEPIFNLQGEVVHWFGTNTDITEKREQAETLRDSQNKLRLALDTNQIGFFEFYFTHERTYWDPMIKHIWGLDVGETATQDHFSEGVHPDDRERVQREIAKSAQVDGSGRYKATYRVKNLKTGELSWIIATGQTLFEDGKPLKMVGLVIDITDRKNLEDSLKQAVKELQAADQSKNEFLSILGHELRNPLAALSGSVDILQHEVPDRWEILRVMQHSVSTMARLLDDLLDLNRVSQNKIQLSMAQLDLAEILGNTLAVTGTACARKQQKLVADIEPEVFVAGDEARLEQIFSNLILNASRYTAVGGTINVTMKKSGQVAEVAVTDNGVGISADFIDRIFDPFFQIKQDQEAASGLGIGLALAKKLVGLHQGEVIAESAGHNQGSTFRVRLPLSQATDIDMAKAAKPPQTIKNGLKVLVVEDNENILATLPILLENLGCEVSTAASGQEGLQKTWSFNPDAILVDIGLPDINGHQVARQLRHDGYQGLLIAVSGYSHTEMRNQSKEAGFNHHLAKPATLVEISDLLSEGNESH